MQASERPEFDAMMDQLCVGLGAVSYDVRKEAYWKGLNKMSLIEFGLVVEFCVSENGPDKVPPVPAVWKLLHTIKAARRAPGPKPVPPPEDTIGLRLVNGMFIQYIHTRRVIMKFKGDINLLERRKAARELADWFDGMLAEGMLPDKTERKELFAKAMERIADAPAAQAVA